MSLSRNKLIERHSSDNSAKTKKITYYAEIEDFLQFSVMTGLINTIDAILYYGFHVKEFFPIQAVLGLDSFFTYPIMFHLARMREHKFRDRHSALNDRNTTQYYSKLAIALYQSMNDEEKAALTAEYESLSMSDRDKFPVILNPGTDQEKEVRGKIWFIIQLLQYNAELLRPEQSVLARTTLVHWNGVFAEVKKRPGFAFLYYMPSFTKMFEHPDEDYLREIFKTPRTFYEYQHLFVLKFLRQYSCLKNKVSEKDAEYFISKLILLEKTHDNETMLDHHRELLTEFGVKDKNLNQAYSILCRFYETYHYLNDHNDKAFYVAKIRGIQEQESSRTLFKIHLFETVKIFSALATAYSLSMFITSLVKHFTHMTPVPIYQTLLPLYLVGMTSLIDEASDLYFKTRKWKQSKNDLLIWEEQHKDLIPNLSSHPQKAREHQELKDRLKRREIKLFQACCSFTGVFFGVLISWTASFVLMFANLPGVLANLGFAGFGTIAMAAMAGVVMVHYQKGQNQKKITQAEERFEKETRTLLVAYPGLKEYQLKRKVHFSENVRVDYNHAIGRNT